MKTKIYKIGVTGSAGSGKSLVCKRFSELGLYVVSSDQIARQVVECGKPAYKKLVDLVGSAYVLEDGSLNRPMLRKLISENPEVKKQLEAIVQPAIINELFFIIDSMEKKGEKIIVAEVPLLFELGLNKKFDMVITIAAGENDMKRRISARDKVTQDEAEKLIKLQMPQKLKIENSDRIIWNNGNIEDLFSKVDKIYSEINDSFVDIRRNLA